MLHVMSTVTARVESISVNELYAQLTSYEQRKEMHGGGSQSSINIATEGGSGGGGGHPYSTNTRGHGGGGRGGFGRDNKGGHDGGGVNHNFLQGVFVSYVERKGTWRHAASKGSTPPTVALHRSQHHLQPRLSMAWIQTGIWILVLQII
jgi:hypothetical protein